MGERTEIKTAEKKRNPRKTSAKEIPEYLYCIIDGWQRTFRFGVNRFRPIKGLQEKEGGYDEWDHLQVFATIRYHHKFTLSLPGFKSLQGTRTQNSSDALSTGEY